jgi:glycosyltransferase involved in cell wall biosynthesis
MLENIVKFPKSTKNSYPFVVLIPTWNNLGFLKNCIKSIRQNSHFEVQIIVIANEAKDGTLEWLMQEKEIDFVHARQNIGICYGLNIARSLIKSAYIVYVNDDMYLLPNWDFFLHEEIQKIDNKQFMLSCTMIEPTNTGNPCVVVKDFGQDIEHFQEELLLKEYADLAIKDWTGSTWPPNVVHIDAWDLVGGLSIEYSPGMYSDPDFSRKLFEIGIRLFKGKGNSLVYHFGSKSTNRIKKNKGRTTFLLKWGISANTFMQQYLKIGKPFQGSIGETILSRKDLIINKLKRMINAW